MQTLSVDRLVGQVLGNYRVEQLLGRGRLNAVFLAQNITTGGQGALTLFMIPDSFSSEARTRFLRRFHKASAALVGLRHKHILPVYEGGEYIGYPFLVTPYMTHGSLADLVKREGRLPHEQVNTILEQIVAGLEFAHNKGIIHGTLRPSNIVLSAKQVMLVAGFGLMHIQQMRGVERGDQPYGHLMSVANTLLVAPEYIAPEIVEGQSIDKRSDIYALGAILYELLSGQPPFTGPDPLTIIKQHVERPVPSLRALCPDVPVALQSVVNQALERDPARRFQSASELAEAFDQVSRGATGPLRGIVGEVKPAASARPSERFLQEEKPSESFLSTKNWQFTPPIVTGKVPAVKQPARQETLPAATKQPRPQTRDVERRPVRQPVVEENLPVMQAPARPASRRVSEKMPAVEPQEMWSDPGNVQTDDIQFSAPLPAMPARPRKPEVWEEKTTRESRQPLAQESGMLPRQRKKETEALSNNNSEEWWQRTDSVETQLPPGFDDLWSPDPITGTLSNSRTLPRRNNGRKTSRRNVVALLAAGGVAAAVGVVALNNSRLLQMATQTMQNTPAANNGATTAGTGNQGKAISTSGAQKQNGGQNTTVVGTATLALNSAATFTNPTDKKSSVLVHLSNGNFVAYERACTHVGVNVNYDPATQLLVCPAHGAIFDPAKSAAVVQGPNGAAPTTIKPLMPVAIKVNADGTITTA